jgi:hypothetical protein
MGNHANGIKSVLRLRIMPFFSIVYATCKASRRNLEHGIMIFQMHMFKTYYTNSLINVTFIHKP